MADMGEGPLTVPREDGYEPYDAASEADCGPWVKIQANLPGGSEDLWHTDFPSSSGWQQT